MQKIEDRVKQGKVKWKELIPIQNSNLKGFYEKEKEALLNSIKKYGFIQSLNCWKDKGKIYTLDGVHRVDILKEIEKEFNIPEELPCNYIECKNRKEAAELVLVYSSSYARVEHDGLIEFCEFEGLDFNDLKMDICLPEFSWDDFSMEGQGEKSDEDIKEKELDENIETDHECPSCGYKW
ncbi:MAG TPA: ParB N-terminal domain-containing protein [Atribacterota bacterium]|nr:ParB N-terminal domain-containing protein [Atribacterota bacterium]